MAGAWKELPTSCLQSEESLLGLCSLALFCNLGSPGLGNGTIRSGKVFSLQCNQDNPSQICLQVLDLDSPLLRPPSQLIVDCVQLTIKSDSYSQ